MGNLIYTCSSSSKAIQMSKQQILRPGFHNQVSPFPSEHSGS
ncbi:AC4 [Bitter gourd yellow vein virus-[Pakistan:Lahore:2004]]|nr:AC4 [Bitter gourd yellow vein virus-[Pakistan:Lahore:2004]]